MPRLVELSRSETCSTNLRASWDAVMLKINVTKSVSMPLKKLSVFSMFSMGTLGSPIAIGQCYILGPAVISD